MAAPSFAKSPIVASIVRCSLSWALLAQAGARRYETLDHPHSIVNGNERRKFNKHGTLLCGCALDTMKNTILNNLSANHVEHEFPCEFCRTRNDPVPNGAYFRLPCLAYTASTQRGCFWGVCVYGSYAPNSCDSSGWFTMSRNRQTTPPGGVNRPCSQSRKVAAGEARRDIWVPFDAINAASGIFTGCKIFSQILRGCEAA